MKRKKAAIGENSRKKSFLDLKPFEPSGSWVYHGGNRTGAHKWENG